MGRAGKKGMLVRGICLRKRSEWDEDADKKKLVLGCSLWVI